MIEFLNSSIEILKHFQNIKNMCFDIVDHVMLEFNNVKSLCSFQI